MAVHRLLYCRPHRHRSSHGYREQVSSVMIFHFRYFVLAIFVCFPQRAHAAAPAEWRGRSIYQVFTDRFARTDGSVTATCAPGYEGYCGGTWKGIISKLDYIKVILNLFPFRAFKFNRSLLRAWGSRPFGYLLLLNKCQRKAEHIMVIQLQIFMV